MKDLRIGVCITGSFCTFSQVLPMIERLSADNHVTAILSPVSATFDTRFYRAEDFRADLIKATGKEPMTTIVQAEEIGPKRLFDAMLIAPCTGNTLAKLNNGITDTCVLMAAKAHLRNNRPLVIAVSTNDALGAAAQNIAGLLMRKNVFFVPYSQDNFAKKPLSMVAHFGLCEKTLEHAMQDRQIQPIIMAPEKSE